MVIILLFTLSILVAIWTHSVVIGMSCIVLLFIISRVMKWSRKTTLVYLLSILSWWCSVMIYDMNHISWTFTASGTTTFHVIEQQRINRYLVEVKNSEPALSADRWEVESQLLLYSKASLQPGDVIQSSRKIMVREYDNRWVWWFGKIVNLWSRQDGQVMDSESFDYDGWLYMQGIDWSLYDDNPYRVESDGWQDNEVDLRMMIRQNIKKNLTSVLGVDVAWALWLGMLIGERSLFHNDEYQSFIDSWLVHLVAVSGGNIAIVVALASLLLFRVPFYARIVLLIVVVLWYSYLVGTDSSVVRATIMAVLTLVVLFPGRQISIWRLLSYAWCLMLLWNPYYIFYDLWFLLSFGALVGIIWADKVVFQKLKGKISWQIDDYGLPRRSSSQWHIKVWEINKFSSSWWKEQVWKAIRIVILPSIGAMIGVLPILIRNTGQINILSPLFNMIVVPFVPFITSLLILLSLWSIGRLSPLVWWMLLLMVTVAQIGADYGLIMKVGRFGGWIIGCMMIGYWVWWIVQEVKRG